MTECPTSPKSPLDQLRQLCASGVRSRYGLSPASVDVLEPDDPVLQRLKWELQVIEQQGCAPPLVAAADAVAFAHSKGIATGPGRGGVSSSLVAYLLGLTTIDPIRHGLIFETFLNPLWTWRPQIQLDVCYLRAQEVADHIATSGVPDDVVDEVQVVPIARLSIVRRAIELANMTGESLTEATIPLDDSATFRLINSGNIDGLWPLQRHIVRQILEDGFTFSSFDDIVALKAVDPFFGVTEEVDPQQEANEAVELACRYLARKSRPAGAESMHPMVRRALRDTFGIVLYRGQQVQILSAVAGLSYAGAELLIRQVTLGESITTTERPQLHTDFITQAEAFGSTRQEAEHAWNKVMRHFCLQQGFALALGLIEYRMAYLKANFAVEFQQACSELSTLFDEEDREGGLPRELNEDPPV